MGATTSRPRRPKHPNHATDLAPPGGRPGVRPGVWFGGDGTLNEAANGLAGSDVAFSFLPGGSTNVVCRMLGVPDRRGRRDRAPAADGRPPRPRGASTSAASTAATSCSRAASGLDAEAVRLGRCAPAGESAPCLPVVRLRGGSPAFCATTAGEPPRPRGRRRTVSGSRASAHSSRTPTRTPTSGSVRWKCARRCHWTAARCRWRSCGAGLDTRCLRGAAWRLFTRTGAHLPTPSGERASRGSRRRQDRADPRALQDPARARSTATTSAPPTEFVYEAAPGALLVVAVQGPHRELLGNSGRRPPIGAPT